MSARRESASINVEAESRPKTKPALRSRVLHVYDGQTRLGKITIADETFTAFDPKGKRLGAFADQTAAAFAIGAAAKADRRG